MKWLLALCAMGGVIAILALMNRSYLRDLKHSLLDRGTARSASDSTTPVAKDVQRHEQFLERIKQGGIDVLFLGDSLTDMWPQVSEDSWRRLAKYKAANFGIGADRTEHVLWRIQHGELENVDPKVVVLLIGTNNLGTVTGERPEWIAKGIHQIVETIRSRLPRTKILLLGIFPRDSKRSPRRQQIAEVNAAVRNFAEGEHILFADFGDSFLQPDGELRQELFTDGLHLTAKGYEVWYQRLDPLLAKLALR